MPNETTDIIIPSIAKIFPQSFFLMANLIKAVTPNTTDIDGMKKDKKSVIVNKERSKDESS